MKIVNGSEADRPENAKARILLERVLSENPVNLVIVYENQKNEITWKDIHGSTSGARGLIEYAHEALYPEIYGE